MTYHELVEQVRMIASKKDASKITDHMAIQFNIEGEAEGAFYIEVYLGHIVVEPYEYYDHDILLAASYQDILSILEGDLSPTGAMSEGRIRVEGNIGRLKLFEEILVKTPVKAEEKKPAAKKTATKKTAAKKSAPKKTTEKKTDEKKAAETKADEKKAAEKKTEEKAGTKTTGKKTASAKTADEKKDSNSTKAGK